MSIPSRPRHSIFKKYLTSQISCGVPVTSIEKVHSSLSGSFLGMTHLRQSKALVRRVSGKTVPAARTSPVPSPVTTAESSSPQQLQHVRWSQHSQDPQHRPGQEQHISTDCGAELFSCSDGQPRHQRGLACVLTLLLVVVGLGLHQRIPKTPPGAEDSLATGTSLLSIM